MTTTQIDQYLDRSLSRIWGTFDLAGYTYEYVQWQDEVLDRVIAVDTETELIQGADICTASAVPPTIIMPAGCGIGST